MGKIHVKVHNPPNSFIETVDSNSNADAIRRVALRNGVPESACICLSENAMTYEKDHGLLSSGMSSNSSSGSSSSSNSFSVKAIGILLILGVIALFAEWFLMIGGGIGGALGVEKILGYKVKDYFAKYSLSSKDVDSNHRNKLLIILITTLICRGIGFGAGAQFKNEYIEYKLNVRRWI